MLERTADARDYKFKFRDEVDPGAAFWRRSSGIDRITGRPIYDEILEEQTLYERDKAAETLDALYKAGRIGPTDMAVFPDSEPTKKHWSRRVHTLERIVDRVPCANPYPAYAPFDDAPKERHLYEEYRRPRGPSSPRNPTTPRPIHVAAAPRPAEDLPTAPAGDPRKTFRRPSTFAGTRP